ncbi:MAG: TIGR03987 family protein [Thermoplasmata archaeon]|nr:MAG: TIGR03987 family protein [Thermoplasmata archaeon]
MFSNLNESSISSFKISNLKEVISLDNFNENKLSNETILKIAIILILLAFICYTVSIWSEKISGVLKTWHVVSFWRGLVFDITGTVLMSALSDDDSESNFLHLLTGYVSIGSMAFHAIIASIAIKI